MADVLSNPPPDSHVSPCGLLCSACGKFKKGRCQGCQIEPGFSRCPVRRCVVERKIETCAECADFRAPRDYRECKKVWNPIARLFGLLFGGDRPAALALLRDGGREAYLQSKRRSGRM